MLFSVFAAVISSFIIAVVYGLVYLAERKRYMGIWVCSWVIHLLRQGLVFFMVLHETSGVVFILYQSLALLSAFLLLWGSMSFINRPIHGKWAYGFISACLWVIIGTVNNMPFLLLTIPFTILLAAASVWNGIVFIRYLDSQGSMKHVLGWMFILWGIHKCDYPLLRTVEWFAPYGYLIGASFELGVSALLILIFMQRIKKELSDAHFALKESMERLELAFTGSSDGLWDWNIKSDILYCSPRYKETLEYEEDEIISGYNCWEGRVHPDDVDRVRSAIDDYLNKRISLYHEEYRMKTKSGDYKWILARGKAVWDEQGRPVRMVGSHTDITDRKNTEFVLQRNMEEAKQFQQKLLPSQLPLIFNTDISTEYLPADKVGGDIYDLFRVDNQLVFYIYRRYLWYQLNHRTMDR